MQPDIDPAFAAVPDRPLPFTGMLVASRNDEACRFDHAEKIAGSWAVELVDAGDAGHINTASGHGPWPEGALRFARFLGSLKPSGV
jgi:predicted alpha/beta hydrolase family esterase